MNPLTKPIRLTWDWYVVWVLMLGVVLSWKPWTFDMPWFSIAAFVLVIPFLMLLGLYVPLLFLFRGLRSASGRSTLFRFLVFVLIASGLFGLLLWSGWYTRERARIMGMLLIMAGFAVVGDRPSE